MRWIMKVRWETICVFAVTLLGVVARSWQIGYGLDSDEIFSAALAGGSFSQFVAGSLHDATHPPLYNLLLHVWLSVFGTSEIAARALSVAFSCGFLAFAYKLLRRYLDAWLALAMLAVFALSPFFVYYGQQVRPYSLICFLSAANLVAFFKALDARKERRPLLIWALSGAALVWSQYLGVFFVGAQIAYAIIYLRNERLRFAAYGAAAIASIAPWVIAAMGASLANRANPVPMIAWMVPPRPANFIWFYASAFGTRIAIRWLLLVLAVPVAFYVRKIFPTRSIPKEHVLLLVLAVGLPSLIFAMSVWGPKPIFVSRQLAGAAVAFVVLVGVMLGSMPRPVAGVIAAVLIGWCAFSVGEWLPQNKNEPWRETAKWLDARYGAADVVVGDPVDTPHLRYYRKLGKIAAWSDLSSAEKSGEFLFLCRPHYCKPLRSDEMRTRVSPLATWAWDRYLGETGFNRFTVYEVHPAQVR
jgi:uncharacterized membrane protein